MSCKPVYCAWLFMVIICAKLFKILLEWFGNSSSEPLTAKCARNHLCCGSLSHVYDTSTSYGETRCGKLFQNSMSSFKSTVETSVRLVILLKRWCAVHCKYHSHHYPTHSSSFCLCDNTIVEICRVPCESTPQTTEHFNFSSS